MIDGTANTPWPDVTTVKVSAVPLFLTTTSAPGTTPPAESTTTPEMDAVDEPWANAPTLVRPAIARAATLIPIRRRLIPPSSCKQREKTYENLRSWRDVVKL